MLAREVLFELRVKKNNLLRIKPSEILDLSKNIQFFKMYILKTLDSEKIKN